MHHTCPHCSAKFDQWHDTCPSCSRPMFKRGLLATILHAIFRPKRGTMTTNTTIGSPRSEMRTSRSVFDDGAGKREWSKWEEVPPEIRVKIESLGGGPGAKEGTLTKQTSSRSIPLADLPPDVRAKLEVLRGDEDVKRIEITGTSMFRETERKRGGVVVDRSSTSEARYRYEDSDGTVHEVERFEDLPEHVQELMRRISGLGGK